MNIRFAAVWIITIFLAGPIYAGGQTVSVDDYPSLDAKQIGHLRHFVKLSRQLPGDWSEMGDKSIKESEDPARYQLAFMTYAAASVQFNTTPAYRELYQGLISRFLVQLRHYHMWGNWVNASRGGGFTDPKSLSELGAGWIDPIKKYNIMYSAHLLQGAALHEALYRTGEFMQPGSLTLVWPQILWGPGRQTFEYSLPTIADNIIGQFRENDYAGVPCEPDLLFPQCNQHAVLGLLLYDKVSGTDYAAELMPDFMKKFEDKEYLDEKTGWFMGAWDMIQDKPWYLDEPTGMDGWAGTFMHAWAPEYIERVYPRQRDTQVNFLLSGGKVKDELFAGGLGYMAMMASEVGDTETVDKILAYADTYFDPVWREGRHYYPRNDGPTSDKPNIRAVTATEGNAMLTFARLNPKDGLLRLHKMWPESYFEQPYIAAVDQGAVGVTQAFYDPAHEALIVGFEPGPLKLTETQFEVHNLDRDSSWNVFKGGTLIAILKEGALLTDVGLEWPKGEAVRISLDVTVPVSLVLQKNSKQQVGIGTGG